VSALGLAQLTFVAPSLAIDGAWTPQHSGTSSQLNGVSCPTTSDCWAAGLGGTIVATTNGGATWTSQRSGTDDWLEGASCPTISDCWAVGFNYANGHATWLIVATTNGGATWTTQSSGTAGSLSGVSCPTTSDCWAVGSGGAIVATTNGGASWTAQSSGTSSSLNGVSCPTTSDCWAVGSGGAIVTTDPAAGVQPVATQIEQTAQAEAAYAQNEASCAQGQVSHPSGNGDQACQAVGTAVQTADNAVATALTAGNGVVNSPPAGQYSNTCTSPGATIADGYAGSNTYVTLRAQPNPSDATQEWVCYRIANPSSGSVGGRVTVGGAGASGAGLPSHDSSAQACSTTSGNQVPPPHPLVNGTLVSQAFMVDTYAASNTAWVCLTAGSVSQRVIVPEPGVSGSPTVFNQLDASPPPLPSPSADPYPSGMCQSSGGSQLMNATAGGTQLWVYSWQPNGSTLDVCARAAGSVTAGGALSVSAAGSPGVSPVLQTGSDATPCTFSIFTIKTPPQAASSLSTSPAGANPATVCVGAGSSMSTYTVGTSGQATLPTVTWTPDPGTP
jgi:hypothetical protein